MRPDESCITGEQTLAPGIPIVPGFRKLPCPYHYMQSENYKCALFDLLTSEAPQKTPRDLMDEDIVDRQVLYTAFIYCVRLILKNPSDTCARCGECCKLYANASYKTHVNLPAKPLDGTLETPANPCTKLIDTDAPLYACELYGTDNFARACLDYPSGQEINLFEQLLDGKTIGQINQFLRMPNCVYEFEREP